MNQAVAEALKEVEQAIDIPLSAHVRCPLAGFKLRAVAAGCPGCEHFRGLADKYPGSKIAFDKRYSVLCQARPTARELFEVEITA